jgi:hypothetical protein
MEYNINHTRGDTFYKEMTFKNPSWILNITWYSIKLTIRKKIDWEIIIQKTATIENWTDWIATIEATGEEMNIDVWQYFYDFQLIDTWTQTTTILKWLFFISYDVT